MGRKGGTLEEELKPSQNYAQDLRSTSKLVLYSQVGGICYAVPSNQLEEVQDSWDVDVDVA